jgi:hypothetical protein
MKTELEEASCTDVPLHWDLITELVTYSSSDSSQHINEISSVKEARLSILGKAT